MSFIFFFIPNIAYAAELGGNFREVVKTVVNIIGNGIIPIVIGLSLLAVFWNLGQYILKSDAEKEREKFPYYAMWSIIAFFVALSVFGIVKILSNTLLGNGSAAIPQFSTEGAK